MASVRLKMRAFLRLRQSGQQVMCRKALPRRRDVVALPLDDPEFCEIVDDFLKDLPEYARSIRRAFAERDFGQLASHSHRLKGVSGMAGFAELMEALRKAGRLPRAAAAKKKEDE